MKRIEETELVFGGLPSQWLAVERKAIIPMDLKVVADALRDAWLDRGMPHGDSLDAQWDTICLEAEWKVNALRGATTVEYHPNSTYGLFLIRHVS
jgi:hypothetical protein